MKNILITFFKVSGLTMIAGLSFFLLLLLLFNDILRESYFLVFIAIFLGGFTVLVSFLVIYLPIYYLRKNLFEQESVNQLYERFLPIAISPLTFIAFLFMISTPHDFFSGDTMLVFILGYIITYFSFYQFIRFMKN
jgi:hypothetical protein